MKKSESNYLIYIQYLSSSASTQPIFDDRQWQFEHFSVFICTLKNGRYSGHTQV